MPKALNKSKKILFIVLTLFLLNSYSVVFALPPAESAFPTTQANAGDDDKPNIAEKFIASIFRGIGTSISLVIGKKGSIDSLVFNNNDSKTTLTLFNNVTNNQLRVYVIQFYNLFLYMAGCFFIPLGLASFGVYIRGSDDPQVKSKAKDRIIRCFITVVLLLNSPIFLDVANVLNNAIVDIFKDFSLGILGKGNITDGFLVDQFKQAAKDSGRIFDSILYLIVTGINIWMLFFYFIRDLTTCFLFIVYPIITIFFPFQRGMVANWFKEMLSNIFGQAIHACIMSFVIGAYGVLIVNASGTVEMYDKLFVLTSFALAIPLTGMFKSLIGLEGRIGAASSFAGVGALMGTISLAKGLSNNVKKKAGDVTGGARDLMSLSTQENNLNNNSLSPDGESKNISGNGSQLSSLDRQLTNPKPPELTLDNIAHEKKMAKRKIASGVSGLVGGGIGAVALGAMFQPMGNNAMGMMSAIGGIGGIHAGSAVAEGAAMAGGYGKFNYDLLKAESSDNDEAVNEFVGMTNPMYQEDTAFAEQEKNARLSKMKYEYMGLQQVADYKYSKLRPMQADTNTLNSLGDDHNIYTATTNKDSIMYSVDNGGNSKILAVGQGDPTIAGGKTRLQRNIINKPNLLNSAEKESEYRSVAIDKYAGYDVSSMAGFDHQVDIEFENTKQRNQGSWHKDAIRQVEDELKNSSDMKSLHKSNPEQYQATFNLKVEQKEASIADMNKSSMREQAIRTVTERVKNDLINQEVQTMRNVEMQQVKQINFNLGISNISAIADTVEVEPIEIQQVQLETNRNRQAELQNLINNRQAY